MINKVYNNLNKLEDFVNNGFPLILHMFIVVNKKKILNILNDIYNSLPQNLHENREILDLLERKNSFKILLEIDLLINQAFNLYNFIFLNKYKIIELIDYLYSIIPEDMREVKNLNQYSANINL